ncbi:MAG: helix-turn-helix domain-containing protein [Opitutales bacterium]|jgi:phage terminase Nu1 subunit (DNA packaging protein)
MTTADSNPSGDEDLITRKQLAAIFGRSVRTIDLWRRQHDLPCLKINHSVYFRKSVVLKHLEQRNGHGPKLNPGS